MNSVLEIKSSGSVEFQEELHRRLEGVAYWSALFIASKIEEGFDTSRDPWGAPWAPLAKSTLEARKRRNVAGIKPLLATEKMFDSLVVVRDKDTAEIRMNSPAGYHQEGTSRMPQRAILPLNGEEVSIPDSWVRDLQDFVSRKVLSVV